MHAFLLGPTIQAEYGPMLKSHLPIHNNTVSNLLVRTIGDHANSLVTKLNGMPGNTQDRKMIALVQASGAGKTQLCFELGRRGFLVIIIRIVPQDLAEDVLALQTLCKGKQDRDIKNLVYLWLGSIFEWYVELLKDYTADKMLEISLVAALKGGQIIHGIFSRNLTMPKNSQHYYSEQRQALQALSPKLVIAFDELGSICEGRSYTRMADDRLFYHVRATIMDLLTNLIHVVYTDMYFDMVEILNINDNSPLRGKVHEWHAFTQFTVDHMCAFLNFYFALQNSLPANCMHALSMFIGRPLFFVGALFPLIVEGMKQMPPQTEQEFFNILLAASETAFTDAVTDFCKGVVAPNATRKALVNRDTPIKALVEAIFYYIVMQDGKFQVSFYV
jgi:hypothetical protein